MIVVGVDVSKDTLVAVAIDKSIRIKHSFTVKNNKESIMDPIICTVTLD